MIYIYIFMCNFLIKPNVMGRELWVFWCLFNLLSADPQASKQLVRQDRQERFYLGWQRPKVILSFLSLCRGRGKTSPSHSGALNLEL